MLRVLVVDDEFPARQELRCILEDIGNVDIVGECTNGQAALDFLAKQSVDVVFLDIEMPVLDGLLVAEKLSGFPQPPKIVFSTGFSQFAVKAFELNGEDYVLKPYTQERLEVTLARITKEEPRKDAAKEENFTDGFKNSTISNKLALWHNDRLLILNPQTEVIMVKTDKQRRILVYTTRGIIASNMSLKDIELRLKDIGFLRTHKSYIVNMDMVSEVIPWFNDTCILSLKNCDEKDIPVSRHFISDFRNILKTGGKIRSE